MQSTVVSPRIASLLRRSSAAAARELSKLLDDVSNSGPLVELHPVYRSSRLVTFIWKGDSSTKTVGLMGGLPDGLWPKPLVELPGHRIWYRTETIPKDAQFSYGFFVNPTATLTLPSFADISRFFAENSLLPDPIYQNDHIGVTAFKMPNAAPRIWSKSRKKVPTGDIHSHTLMSKARRREITIRVYTPSAYVENDPSDLLLAFDGETCDSLIPIPTILDNLIAAKKIRPTVALLVDSGDQDRRFEDLGLNEEFTKCIAKEIVPWAQKRYRVATNSPHTTICGFSLGGLCAAYTALRYPLVFGNVISQSGSFGFVRGSNMSSDAPPLSLSQGWIIEQYLQSPRMPVKFYIDVGRFEQALEFNMLHDNRRMRDVLLAKGYSVTYAEMNSAHDYLAASETFAHGLIALRGR